MTATNSAISDWLSTEAKPLRRKQLVVLAIRLVQLLAQIMSFSVFASLMAEVIVFERSITGQQVLPLIISGTTWALTSYAADRFAFALQWQSIKSMEKRLNRALLQQQTALTRRFSATFWQQLVMTNIPDVAEYFTQYCIQKWLAAIAPVLVILILIPVNYVVALTLLMTFPIIPLFMILVGKHAAQLHRRHFIALERLGDLFSDRLKALPLLTATNQHATQQARLADASDIVNRKTMQVVRVAFLSNTVLDFFATIAIALIAVFIGFSLLGEISIGPEINFSQGLFMLLVAPLLFSELKALGRYYHQKAKAEAGAERLHQVLGDTQESYFVTRFEGVTWLNYQVAKPRLHANKITLSKGDWILLSGDSGSGKTALMEAFMSFRQASHAFPVRPFMLGQQATILDASLAHNLCLGKDSISTAQMLNALSAVQLDNWFARLPQGLDTELGDHPPLSGGEAHRLALARVLLHEPDIVLLDEPTAHLTHEQHLALAQLLRQKLHDKTVIWASHKPIPTSWFSQHWQIADGEIHS